MQNWSNLYKYPFNIIESSFIPTQREEIVETEIISCDSGDWRSQLSNFNQFLKSVKFKTTVKTETKIVEDNSVYQIGNYYYYHPSTAMMINSPAIIGGIVS